MGAPNASAGDREAEARHIVAAIEQADPAESGPNLRVASALGVDQQTAAPSVATVRGRHVQAGRVGVVVPGATDEVVAQGGISMFQGGNADIAVRDRHDGVQFLAVLKARGAATTYDFAFPGSFLEPREDGTIDSGRAGQVCFNQDYLPHLAALQYYLLGISVLSLSEGRA